MKGQAQVVFPSSCLSSPLAQAQLPNTKMFSRKFFASIVLAIACASSSAAAPWPSSSKHTTHRVREISPDLQLETYHPESTYEVSKYTAESYLRMHLT